MQIQQYAADAPRPTLVTDVANRSSTTPSASAQTFVDIANLPECALEKLSGVKYELGRGSYGAVTRQCVKMPHPSHIVSAVKFVAVKQLHDPRALDTPDEPLRELADLPGYGRQHILSAQAIVGFDQVGTQLAHTTLMDFLFDVETSEDGSERLKVKEGVLFTCRDFLVLIRDLSLGLDSLHSIGMFHGDVACRNVLVGPAGYLWCDIDGRRGKDIPTQNDGVRADIADLTETLADTMPAIDGYETFVEPPYSSLSHKSSCLIADELVRRGAYSSRAEEVLNAFDRALLVLWDEQPHDATLISLASMADELIGFLRNGDPIVSVSRYRSMTPA